MGDTNQGSSHFLMGASSLLLSGRKLNSSLIPSRPSMSLSKAPWATPETRHTTYQSGIWPRMQVYLFIFESRQWCLTRFAIQAKGPDDKWTRKPLAYRESNNVHLLITRPPEICVNLVFKHIHAASSYIICRQFVPFIYCPL